MDKNVLYRLSATIFPDDSFSINRTTTIRKVIESYFIESDNNEVDINNIQLLINDLFGILVTPEEIRAIVLNNDIFIIKSNRVQLSDKRYKSLKDFRDKHSIKKYIDEFFKDMPEAVKEWARETVDEVIDRFLYGIFIQNLDKLKAVFQRDVKLDMFLSKEKFSDDEIRLVNDFLDYDNKLKDKAIFDIASLSLEYIALNGKVDLKNQISNIGSKVLYLDTNILFRGLGLDGEGRKDRISLFLKKCSENGQELRISRATEKEFFSTIDYYLNPLEAISRRRVYYQPIDNSVIADYYRRKNNRHELTIGYYKELLRGEYKAFAKMYRIGIEGKDFYKAVGDKIKDLISEKSDKLKEYKESVSQKGISEIQTFTDAINITQISMLRQDHQESFTNTKYFMISADKKLADWEKLQNQDIPIVMCPSDWLSILLRYSARTSDDYKAFVCFLRGITHNQIIPQENIIPILDGISAIAEDIENQRVIFDELVNNKYHLFVDKKPYKEIRVASEEEATNILEHKIAELEEKNLAIIAEQEQSRREREQDRKVVSEVKEESESRSKKSELLLHREIKKVHKRELIEMWASLTIIVLLIIYVCLNDSVKSTGIYLLIKALQVSDNMVISFIGHGILGFPFVILGGLIRGIYQRMFGSKTLKTKLINATASLKTDVSA